MKLTRVVRVLVLVMVAIFSELSVGAARAEVVLVSIPRTGGQFDIDLGAAVDHIDSLSVSFRCQNVTGIGCCTTMGDNICLNNATEITFDFSSLRDVMPRYYRVYDGEYGATLDFSAELDPNGILEDGRFSCGLHWTEDTTWTYGYAYCWGARSSVFYFHEDPVVRIVYGTGVPNESRAWGSLKALYR